MREKAIEELKKDGYNAIEENGVLMIIYSGPKKDFTKAFNAARNVAAAAGYYASIGIRGQEKGEKKNENDISEH